MPQQFKENVIQTLAEHLGVPEREIVLTDDLYQDWGLTPLSLVVVLLDLERSVAVEIPSDELSSVRTVADLVAKFRASVQQSDARSGELPRLRARRSRAHRARDGCAASCTTCVGSSKSHRLGVRGDGGFSPPARQEALVPEAILKSTVRVLREIVRQKLGLGGSHDPAARKFRSPAAPPPSLRSSYSRADLL